MLAKVFGQRTGHGVVLPQYHVAVYVSTLGGYNAYTRDSIRLLS